MKALVLNSSNTPFSYQNVPDPSPKKGEAVAKILACGSEKFFLLEFYPSRGCPRVILHVDS